MQYPVDTQIQLRGVLKALRQARNLSQADLGRLLGVNQKRIARIEAVPGVTSFDQIARIVAALGGRIVIDDSAGSAKVTPAKPTLRSKAARGAAVQASW